MVRLNTSRPKRSVPNRCARDGALSASATFISVGSYGATRSAPTASAIIAATTATPTCIRRFAPTAARTRGREETTSAVADAVIDIGVDEIYREIGEHEERGHEEDRPLHDGIVALEHRPEEQAADARKREHLLRHHG